MCQRCRRGPRGRRSRAASPRARCGSAPADRSRAGRARRSTRAANGRSSRSSPARGAGRAPRCVPFGPLLLAPLPPSRQPRWYTVMDSNSLVPARLAQSATRPPYRPSRRRGWRRAAGRPVTGCVIARASPARARGSWSLRGTRPSPARRGKRPPRPGAHSRSSAMRSSKGGPPGLARARVRPATRRSPPQARRVQVGRAARGLGVVEAHARVCAASCSDSS